MFSCDSQREEKEYFKAPRYTAAVYNLVLVARSKNGNPYYREIHRGGVILSQVLANKLQSV